MFSISVILYRFAVQLDKLKCLLYFECKTEEARNFFYKKIIGMMRYNHKFLQVSLISGAAISFF